MSISDATNTTNDSHTEPKQTPQRCKMEDKAEPSLLMPLDESRISAESSIEDDSSAIEMVQVILCYDIMRVRLLSSVI